MDLRSRPKVKLRNKFTSITKVYNSPLYREMGLRDQLPPKLQKEENNIKFKSDINRYVYGTEKFEGNVIYTMYIAILIVHLYFIVIIYILDSKEDLLL